MLPLVAIALVVIGGMVVLEVVSYRALERTPSVTTEESPHVGREEGGHSSLETTAAIERMGAESVEQRAVVE